MSPIRIVGIRHRKNYQRAPEWIQKTASQNNGAGAETLAIAGSLFPVPYGNPSEVHGFVFVEPPDSGRGSTLLSLCPKRVRVKIKNVPLKLSALTMSWLPLRWHKMGPQSISEFLKPDQIRRLRS